MKIAQVPVRGYDYFFGDYGNLDRTRVTLPYHPVYIFWLSDLALCLYPG
jgi:hypothetical protein